MGYLAQREHSRTELRRKLLNALKRVAQRQASNCGSAARQVDQIDPSGDLESTTEPSDENVCDEVSTATVDALLDALTAEGWLSQERFVDSRLRTRAPRLGARRLQAELAQHGLTPEGEVWDHVQATEAERAQSLLMRRFGDAPPPDDKERARRIRFLVSRGFATDLALRLTRG